MKVQEEVCYKVGWGSRGKRNHLEVGESAHLNKGHRDIIMQYSSVQGVYGICKMGHTHKNELMTVLSVRAFLFYFLWPNEFKPDGRFIK